LIQRFCTRALWLENGQTAMLGDAREVVTAYEAFCQRLENERLNAVSQELEKQPQESSSEAIVRDLRLIGSRWGNGHIKLTKLELLDASGEAKWLFNTGEAITVRLSVTADQDYDAPIFAIDFHRFDGFFIGSINNYDTHPARLPIQRGVNVFSLYFPKLDLPQNSYFLSFKAYTKADAPLWPDPADIHNQMYPVTIVAEQVRHGLLDFEARWTEPSTKIQK
jgi:hypothetical protein